MASSENIYSSIQNLYNMDKNTWQEVLAELYNLVYDTQSQFEQVEAKYSLMLGDEVTRKLKEMFDDGTLTELINDIIQESTSSLNEQVNTLNEQVNSLNEQVEKLDEKISNNIGTGTGSGNSISDLHVYKVTEQTKNTQDTIENLSFEINNLKTRCTKYDNYEFKWKTFDKAYFAIVIDDSNAMLASFYDVAHSKNVPISTSCIHTRLNNTEQGGTRTIRQINNLIVADGGEILAHYIGSPNENTSNSVWLSYTRDVKKALMEEGWKIRGIMRADNTLANSNKGETICKEYFDYADTMGISSQYNLGSRKLLIGVKTLSDFQSWVDACCQTPGFYPICVHGLRDDEPLATSSNLGSIIDYIKAKSNAKLTTYSYVFDNFGTTK